MLKVMFLIWFRLIFPTKTLNKKVLKRFKGKPVILAMNHRNGIDGPNIFMVVFERKLSFWVKEEFFKKRFWRIIWRLLGGIPVKQGASLSLFKNTKSVFDKNGVLAIWPTGHRNFGAKEEISIRGGSAAVAKKYNVPIIPVLTDRQNKLFRLTKMKFCEPIFPENFETVDALSQELQDKMRGGLCGFEKAERLKKWEIENANVVRGIVLRDGKILMLKRVNRMGKTYYVYPGGHVEDGEDAMSGAEREILEETGVVVNAFRKLYRTYFCSPRGDGWQDFFVCQYQCGEPHKTDAEEYTNPEIEKANGTYEPMWIDIKDLKKIDTRPANLTRRLLKNYKKKGERLSFPLQKLRGSKADTAHKKS